MMGLAFAALLALVQAEPASHASTEAPSRQGRLPGSQDSATREGIGPPAAGVEQGMSNGMAGGRTDQASRERTGVRATPRKSVGEDRGPNAKGSLLRPADRDPDAAPQGRSARRQHPTQPGPAAHLSNTDDLVAPEPAARTVPSHGSAGGAATEGAPGGSATDGPAGKGAARGGNGTDSGPHPK